MNKKYSSRMAYFLCLMVPSLVYGQVLNLEVVNHGYVDGETSGSRGILYNGTGGSGAGMFTSFMSLQQNGMERGINHDNNQATFNESTGESTQDIRASEFKNGLWFDPVTQQSYYQFSIDVNQVNKTPSLSLDNIRIFSSSTPITAFNSGFVTDPNGQSALPSGGSSLIWELDTSTHNNTVLLPYDKGSGWYEASVYVPARMFEAAIQANSYVYFYAQLGGYDGHPANDGPEEWAVNVNPGVIPEPCEYGLGTVLVLLGLAAYERRRRSRPLAIHA